MGIVSEPWGRGKGFTSAGRRDAYGVGSSQRDDRGAASLRQAGAGTRGHTPACLRAERGVGAMDRRTTAGGLMRCLGQRPGFGPAGGRRRGASAPRGTAGIRSVVMGHPRCGCDLRIERPRRAFSGGDCRTRGTREKGRAVRKSARSERRAETIPTRRPLESIEPAV
jgi:hypothetical protein